MKMDFMTTPACAQSLAACRRLARKSHSNFVLAFRFLPADKRTAMTVLYAYLRWLDDLADTPLAQDDSLESRKNILKKWQETIGTLAVNGPRDWEADLPGVVLLPALAAVVRKFKIPTESLTAVIDGMITDLAPDVRFADEPALSCWCDQVATAVGQATLAILGCSQDPNSPPIIQLTQALAHAFQYTNILRDIREDIAANRLYFPLSELNRFGLDMSDFQRATAASPAELLARFSDNNDPLARFLAERIEKTEWLFRQSRPLFAYVDRDSRRVLQLMDHVYFSLFTKIRHRPSLVFHKPARLSLYEKLLLLGRCWTDSTFAG
ncbi:MAG: squalene/phytoene synthase family protein [Planctomycetia bacterium]|nr:squalene/phytoene synthase family protein [Planctomycetia bacterium]